MKKKVIDEDKLRELLIKHNLPPIVKVIYWKKEDWVAYNAELAKKILEDSDGED